MQQPTYAQPGVVGQKGQKRPRVFPKVPAEWALEFPGRGATDNSSFGGCRRIEDAYDRLTELGQGTYGEVFRARDKATGEEVAIKKIKMDNEKEGFPITAIREIKLLSQLAECNEKLVDDLMRNNIIKLREIVRSDSHESNNGKGSVYMVFDYMEHDLAGLMERASQEKARLAASMGQKPPQEGPFLPGQAKRYMKQLFLGLALLQSKKILHRDLKNANLLISNKGELKIADFGLARTHYGQRPGNDDGLKPDKGADGQPKQGAQKMTNRVITLWYRPPELCLGAEYYGAEVDMWSAGCIMAEMLTGRPLFPGQNEADQVQLICRVLGAPTEESMPGCTQWRDYQAMKDSMQGWSGCPPTSRLRMTLQQRGIKDPLALDLIEKLLALNPAHRISASTAALDIWFNSEPAMMDLGKMPKYEPSHEMTMKNKRAADKARRQEAAHGGDGRGQHPPGALPHQMAQHGGMGGHYPMRPPGGYVGGAVPVTAYQHGGQPYMGPGDRRPPGGPPLPSWQQERR